VADSWLHGGVCRQRPELCRTVCDEWQNSNLSLYCTPHYSADSATVAPSLYKLCNYTHYLCAILPSVDCSTIYIINKRYTVPESVISLLLYCNMCNVIIWRIVQEIPLVSSDISQFA